VQKGPSFRHPVEVSIDGSTGEVSVRSTDDDGHEKLVTDRLDVPADLANGMVFTLLKNVRPGAPLTRVSMVAATPKPRLVKLAITSQGNEAFSVAGSTRTATLPREGGDRGRFRAGGTAAGKITAGYSRLGAWRAESGFR
jgi:hypothetical protein